MAVKTIPDITVFHLGFDQLAEYDDRSILAQMTLALRGSKKRLFQKGGRPDHYSLSRKQNIITIDFFKARARVARFSFRRTELN